MNPTPKKKPRLPRGPYRAWMQPAAERNVCPRQTAHNDRKRCETASQTDAPDVAIPCMHAADAMSHDVTVGPQGLSTSHGDSTDDLGSSSDEYFDCSDGCDTAEEDTSDAGGENTCEDPEGQSREDNDFQAFLRACGSDTLPHQNTTKLQALLLVMMYIVSAGLTWSQVDGLLDLINTLLGQDVLPKSKYMLRKLWKDQQQQLLRLHFFCSTCFTHLGDRGHSVRASTFSCDICSVTVTQTKLITSGSFFIMFDIKKQLQFLLKHVGAVLLNQLRMIAARPQAEGTYSDVTDGQLYKTVREKLNMKWSDFTVTFNSDGSAAFKSSKASVWPVQVMVNELPVRVRWNNILVCGLWFAKVHPPVHLLVSSFVQQFNKVGEIVWQSAGAVVKSKVYAVCCVADSPARASILNRKLYNGYYGCSWCLKRGELVDGTLKYAAHATEELIERTHKTVLRAMKLAALRGEDVDGIKGPSPIIELQGLNLVWGVPPDYMHCILLGVAKFLTELWVMSVGERYYIGRHLHIVNKRLCAITPPESFTRLTRSLKESSFWKASEWKNWTLYYMLPTLYGILPAEFMMHASMLAGGLFLLLKSTVTEHDIATAEDLFMSFACNTADLYGEFAVRFNVHQLLHMAKSVRMMGPLWATSMFPFEGGNGRLVKLISAAKGVPLQIAERLVMRSMLNDMERAIPLSGSHKPCAQRLMGTRTNGTSTYALGAPTCPTQLSGHATELLFEKLGRVVAVEQYLRACINNITVHAAEYARVQRTCSCYLKMQDQTYCQVKEIFMFRDTRDRIALLCKRLITRAAPFVHALYTCCCEHPPGSEELYIYMDEEVDSQLVFVKIENSEYLCEQPNRWETD